MRTCPFFLSAILGLTIYSSCTPFRSADAANPGKAVVEPVTDAAVDNGVSYFAEIEFEKGKSTLDSKASKNLNDLMQRSSHAGELKDIKILSFSDQSFGNESQHDFLKRQKHLADVRSESIKKYLSSQYPLVNVESYNMASNPDVLENLVKTSDANVRKTLEDAGVMVGNDQNACVPKIVSKSLIVSIVKKSLE